MIFDAGRAFISRHFAFRRVVRNNWKLLEDLNRFFTRFQNPQSKISRITLYFKIQIKPSYLFVNSFVIIVFLKLYITFIIIAFIKYYVIL